MPFNLKVEIDEKKQSTLEFHYQMMEPLFRKAAKGPAKIIDMIGSIKRHPTKKWRQDSIDVKTKLVLHQTACWANIHEIASFDVREHNWPGFSYHYLIEENGYILRGNYLTDRCYHAKGVNTVGVGVALKGRFYSRHCEGTQWGFTHSFLDKGDNAKKVGNPTSKQIISTIRLFDYLQIKLPKVSLDGTIGHNIISPRSRACDPGDAMDLFLMVYRYARGKEFYNIN